MLLPYLKFLIKSKNEHSLHSPFVFELYTKIIKSKKSEPVYNVIEKFRKEQLSNTNEIEITDFGAGSKHNKSNKRLIAEIAKHAEKPAKFGQLLYRLIQFFKPKTIFDLGTSLGISTLYQSKAAENFGKVISFEGCPATAQVASDLFEHSNVKNVLQVVGNLDETLAQELKQIEQLDFAFFDANHRFTPTINYFEQCLKKASVDSVFVFDDIHWSPEMEQAWAYIKNHDEVIVTIDLFYVGLVFFRKKQPKQHFVLRF